jgi:hypothetical protein
MVRTALIVAALVAAAPAFAQAPAALVEDVESKSAGVEFMDYVPAGKVIRLGRGDTLVLSYLKTCWRETIAGGTVTIGAEQSEIDGGKVERVKVRCDAGKLQLTEQQAAKSGAMAFRKAPTPAGRAAIPAPQLTLYGLSPLIDLPGGGPLVLERLDAAGEKHALELGAARLLRGAMFDCAKAGIVLTAGGVYRASSGQREIVFRIDPNATGAGASLVGRLLKFTPA